MAFTPNTSHPIDQKQDPDPIFTEFDAQWDMLDHFHGRQQYQNQTIQINSETLDNPPYIIDDNGAWHIIDYELAQAVLDGPVGKPAPPPSTNGTHAKTTSDRHSTHSQDQVKPASKLYEILKEVLGREITPSCQAAMAEYANQVINQLGHASIADLSTYSFNLATVGISHLIGVQRPESEDYFERVKRYLSVSDGREAPFVSKWFNRLLKMNAERAIFNTDVRPSIKSTATARGTLIATLSQKGFDANDIGSTSLKFMALGIKPTHQFINNAFLYLMRAPNLRESYIQADEHKRRRILQEILRVEPIIDNIVRFTQEPIDLPLSWGNVSIPANAVVYINVHQMNQDERAVGNNPRYIDPARIPDIAIPLDALSFGYGNHRCPADQIAIYACDILLSRVLAMPKLRIKYRPDINQNQQLGNYEIENLIVTTF